MAFFGWTLIDVIIIGLVAESALKLLWWLSEVFSLSVECSMVSLCIDCSFLQSLDLSIMIMLCTYKMLIERKFVAEVGMKF